MKEHQASEHSIVDTTIDQSVANFYSPHYIWTSKNLNYRFDELESQLLLRHNFEFPDRISLGLLISSRWYFEILVCPGIHKIRNSPKISKLHDFVNENNDKTQFWDWKLINEISYRVKNIKIRGKIRAGVACSS